MLSAKYYDVERARAQGEVTEAQWTGFRALWFYGAPRFSELVPWLRVRDINAGLDIAAVSRNLPQEVR
jgi:hypothetical protein